MNFAGQIMPFLAAVVSMPVLAKALGIERLGLLNLAWVVLGSFSLLDLGLGRALTQVAAARLTVERSDALFGLLVAGCGMLFGVGFVAAASLWIAAPWLVSHSITVSLPLHREPWSHPQLLAIGLPFWRGVTAAWGFSKRINADTSTRRTPLGASSRLGAFRHSTVFAFPGRCGCCAEPGEDWRLRHLLGAVLASGTTSCHTFLAEKR